VGAPVATADCVALARTEPEQAVRQLTARLHDALRALIVEAGDRETLRLLTLAGAIWGGDAGATTAGVSRAEELRQLSRAYRHLREREPRRVAALRAALAAYASDLARSGLPLTGLPGGYPPGAVARYALREGVALLVALPLALWASWSTAPRTGWSRWRPPRRRPTPTRWPRSSSGPASSSTPWPGSGRRGSLGGSAGPGS
jgi:hypothetical protein